MDHPLPSIRRHEDGFMDTSHYVTRGSSLRAQAIRHSLSRSVRTPWGLFPCRKGTSGAPTRPRKIPRPRIFR